jgi:hypothetical protein
MKNINNTLSASLDSMSQAKKERLDCQLYNEMAIERGTSSTMAELEKCLENML